MIDGVCVLGQGSLWEDTELRYSLRSIQKHVRGIRDIYVVGFLPDFIKDVVHIPFGDEHVCKETNIYRKVLRACQDPNISEDFFFFNDDHFMLEDCIADQYQFYHKGDLRMMCRGLRAGNPYRAAVENTYIVLHKHNNLPTRNFDGHCPIIYNKKFMLDRITRYDWNGRISYVLKSLYANTKLIVGEKMADCKIGSNHTVEEIKEIIKKKILGI